MTAQRPNILIIDDEAALTDFFKGQLEHAGYSVVTETSAEAGTATVRKGGVDVVVTDLHLAGPTDFTSKEGFKLISELHEVKPDLPIILMTADKTSENAIEAMKVGAFDYITKATDKKDVGLKEMLQDLRDMIDEAVAASRPHTEPRGLDGEAPEKYAIIGNSRGLEQVCKQIGKFARTPYTVLILGETGTGKELVARAVHRHSDRLGKPFIAVNCAAITETLMESELFGHVRGAFTDANRDRIGTFELANRGTLFLDEIGDMSFKTQAKLLRVLQEKVIQRVGSNETVPVDVRIIAATHHDLVRDISESRFRADLFHRLNQAVITLPPLRERKEDIPALVRFFLERSAAERHLPVSIIDDDAVAALQNRPWPGNVRDLENAVRKAMALAGGYAITAQTVLNALGKTDAPPHPEQGQTLAMLVSELLGRAEAEQLENAAAAFTWDTEYELYKQVIKRANGNQVKAAKWLGVSRTTMREKLRLFGLHSIGSGSI